MIYYISQKVKNEFHSNLTDWYLGGPKPEGWTRTGCELRMPNIDLNSYYFKLIDVDEGLAKNKYEISKWHISFLKGDTHLYEQEYLKPRYDKEKSIIRIKTFMSLLNDIKINGIKNKVWVAEVKKLNIGFDYFRFDGCHRLCCAKFLGIKQVPAIIFRTSLI